VTDHAQAFARLVPSIRSQFPQLQTLLDGTSRIYLDNAAGTLTPRPVADAMSEAAVWANPQPGRGWPAGPETTAAHRRTRALLAAFLNARPADRIFLSESSTSSLYKLREGLEPQWGSGDNAVVTDCDHFANISAWEWRARWEVRRAAMLPDGRLDLSSLAQKVDAGTRVVGLTMASNGLGTVIRLDEAIPLVRRLAPEAVVVVDAVHAAPHMAIDVQALGADALAFSTYKLFGPNCGVLWLREGLLERMQPYRVEPHTDVESLMEWGTLSNAWVAGIAACLEYLQRLGERLEPAFVGLLAAYPRDRRLFKLALSAIRTYEQDLSRALLPRLAALPGVELFGVTDPERGEERVPTFAFAVTGRDDAEIERRLWETAHLQVAAGTHYSAAVLCGLGRKSVLRASFAHYNTPEEAQAFAGALSSLTTDPNDPLPNTHHPTPNTYFG
jgi:selenocysteine lyase/cysteine desulfurase